MSLEIKWGKDLWDEDECVLQTDFKLAGEEEGRVLDALAKHLSRLDGVWAYHADGIFQIRYTPWAKARIKDGQLVMVGHYEKGSNNGNEEESERT